MGIKLLGFVASMLNFSRLVEILYSCHCMQFCALPGTQASSQMTERDPVVPLWKGKGDRQDCNNREVRLLSVPGKVFAWIILDRVRHHLLEQEGRMGVNRVRELIPKVGKKRNERVKE